eukprot:TRINITY_DN715_c0_g1_i6.p1 TRINITY_DN715_c0_g1~~TRINITY_DN715_c0_g1_i6.p1  ORF type:complete len:406 (-),score=40.46 TRINITY_DN715_c0_g1_i6:544-1761(-)
MLSGVSSLADCCDALSKNPSYNVFVYCPRQNNCYNQLNPADQIPFQACYLKYQQTVALGNQPDVYREGPGVDFISGHIPFKIRDAIECTSASAVQCDGQVLLLLKSRMSAESQQFYSSWTGLNPCDGSWRHVVCGNEKRVTQLVFGSTLWFQSSQGVWGRSFGNNGQTTRFIVSIPIDITKMQFLELISTGFNGFSGPLIPELSTMTRLLVLDVKEGFISGTVPAELSVLDQLQVLDFSTNKIQGTFPLELSTNSKLQFFRTSRNKDLTSTLPVEYSSWKEMQFFEAWESNLSGSIPVEYSEFQKITGFQLNGNNLAGVLPVQFSVWSNINTFHVPGNNLFGSLPSAYSTFAPTASLWFGSNAFTGVVPVEYSKFSNLRLNSQTGDLCVEDFSVFQDDFGLPICA